MSIADIRKEYMLKALMEHEVHRDPIRQFDQWWQEALSSKIEEVNAMTLATVDKNGIPSARIVLLKGYDDKGFVFYTNYRSHKAKDMEDNPNVSIVFFWKELERQVRMNGKVEKLSAEESDIYFNSRPLISQLGAWASEQSAVIASRAILESQFEALQKKYQDGPIPRPSHWGGYLVVPEKIEFWQGRPGRLHDRIEYTQQPQGEWLICRRSP